MSKTSIRKRKTEYEIKPQYIAGLGCLFAKLKDEQAKEKGVCRYKRSPIPKKRNSAIALKREKLFSKLSLSAGRRLLKKVARAKNTSHREWIKEMRRERKLKLSL